MPLTTGKTPAMRLPPLRKLRLRHPSDPEANPCLGIMASVLGCWASAGFNLAKCGEVEQALRTCMDEPRPKNPLKNPINHHLSRLYPRIKGPYKRK